MKIEARPWQPQDLLDDLQGIIDEESDNYLNTRRTTLEMALAYLKEHFDEPKWIPVTERLPEKDKEVLCLLGDGEFWLAVWDHCDDGLWTDGERWVSKCFVTHWMPLPEPPKEVAHDE